MAQLMSKQPNALDYLKNKASNLKPKKTIENSTIISWEPLQSIQPNNYLQVLEQRKQELKSKLNNDSKSSPIPILNFWVWMSWPWVTNFADYKTNIPQQTQPTKKSGFSLIPKTNAWELDEVKIEQFIKRWQELWKSREEIKVAYDKALNDWIFDVWYTWQPQATQDINDMWLLQEWWQRLSNLWTKLWKRWESIWQSFNRPRSSNPLIWWVQNIWGAIWVAWELIWWLTDIWMEWLAYLTPDVVKEVTPAILKQTAKNFWQAISPIKLPQNITPDSFKEMLSWQAKEVWENTPEVVKQTALTSIKAWPEVYAKFKKSNPFLADTLEWSLSIASVLPIWKGWKIVKEWVETWVKEVWEQLWKQAGKKAIWLETKALEETRKIAEEIALPSIKELWKRQKWEVFWEVVETWKWLFKKQELVRSPKEALAIEETTRLINEWKLSKWMSEIQKRTVVENEIEQLSKILDTNLRTTDIQLSQKDMNKLFNDLSQQILDNPVIVWDAEASLKKLLPVLKTKLNKKTYYPEDILQLRKDFDNAIKNAKWEWVFDPKTENAFTTAIRDFRQWLNNKVSDLVPDANVKQVLDRQSALYNVSKTLNDRFSWQANTLVWRVLNKIQWITWVPRTEIVELATALWLAWTVAPIIAPVSWIISAWYLWKKWLQYLTRPENMKKVAEILRKFENAVKQNPSKATEINKAKEEFKNIFVNPIKNGSNSSIINSSSISTNKSWWNLIPNQTKNAISNSNIQKTTKTRWEGLKKILPSNFKEKAQDLIEGYAEKVGAKKNFLPSWNNKINYKEVENYYKQKTWNNDVTEIMDRFKKSSMENQQSVMKKINTPKVIEINKPKENILDSLNPTWWLYVKYTPEIRAKAKLWPNITTLDKTMWVSPDKEIIIYRWAPKSQKWIVAWDFVTTNYDLAKSYTWDWNILKLKVKARDVLDDITEPLWEEYIYRPKTNLLPTNSKQVSKSIPEKIYHTSSVDLPEKLSWDKIFWTTKDKNYSLNYWKEWSRKTYEFSTEWLNILDWYSKKWIELAEKINKSLPKNKQFTEVLNQDWWVSSFFIQDKDVVKKLKDLWYDWIETSEFYKWWTKSIWIINADKLKQVSNIVKKTK